MPTSTARRTDPIPVDDRRSEPRVAADGDVRLRLDDGGPAILAKLIDISSNGFRAAHQCAELHAGMELDFADSEREGRARVMWNRSADGNWISGFFIVLKR